jgi:hypothetical protein
MGRATRCRANECHGRVPRTAGVAQRHVLPQGWGAGGWKRKHAGEQNDLGLATRCDGRGNGCKGMLSPLRRVFR